MAKADDKIIGIRKWVKLADYAERKTAGTEDPDTAHGWIVRELETENEGLLPYRYKRADETDGHWHLEGLPIGYLWRDAGINWASSSASWKEHIAPVLGFLRELRIYRIEVAVPIETTVEPEPVALAPADEPIPEPDHAAMLVAEEAGEPETAIDDVPAESAASVERTDAPVTELPSDQTNTISTPVEQVAVVSELVGPTVPTTRHARLISVYFDLELPSGLKSAQIEQRAKALFHRWWPDETKLCLGNRRTTKRAYDAYIASDVYIAFLSRLQR